MKALKDYWVDLFEQQKDNTEWFNRKLEGLQKRQAQIVRTLGNGRIYREMHYDGVTVYDYLLHIIFYIKQKEYFYMEEEVVPYSVKIENDKIIDHKRLVETEQIDRPSLVFDHERSVENERFSYDRRAAVQYAERWWNSYNPAYRQFDVDCTNYVSQCLRAGGAPMWGSPNRSKGWWYGNNNWSYSWSVSHSLRWYLSGSTQGLTAKEVSTPDQLLPGDVICYDFQGDGRWDHSTIVVAKDIENMPLVNAHTDNSRMRYWTYEDSMAWTPEIEYKFFQIG